MFYSTKLGNLLFGKHSLAKGDQLNVQTTFTRPDGEPMKWPGYSGVLFMFYDRIVKLEAEIEALKTKKK